MNLITTGCLILIASLIGLESERAKPRPYPLGLGDTLMIRIQGYEFCPKYCDINHFHTGHFKNYDCEEIICEHITINENDLGKLIMLVWMTFMAYCIFLMWQDLHYMTDLVHAYISMTMEYIRP